ncbi:GNAT family N-acetyltransferase [Streptomyces monticola]|uniref:GNAT family N-acetyltransferase n=1 Tax=Streptomyces monticola TaxID=2666263 RepID=A0ABW2JW70_9ACTN
MVSPTDPEATLEPWSEGDFWLLERQNTPEMTEHLGGPETAEKLVDRHRRYLLLTERGRVFRITVDGRTTGSIGYWEQEWQGGTVWETGWGVLPEFQGRGIAVAAARLVLDAARTESLHRFVHAFPSTGNPGSNAVCRKAGFHLVGDSDLEYPKGHWSRHNDWRFDLEAEAAAGAEA